MNDIKRGQLWYCDFGECLGSEQSGVRPCVIIQNDKGNQYSTTTIVCPITTKNKSKMPTHVAISTLPRPSVIICEQIRTIDKSRLLDHAGSVSDSELTALNRAIKISIEG